MANITRFDPFSEPFEDIFRRMLRPIRWEGEAAAPEIKVDVEESDKAYVVKAEIPGVKKEDIDVQIDGNVVSISAESKREKKVEEKGKVIRSERYYGSMLRSFSLAHDVDQAEANAKYADGDPGAHAAEEGDGHGEEAGGQVTVRVPAPASAGVPDLGSRRADGRLLARGDRRAQVVEAVVQRIDLRVVRFGNVDAELVVDGHDEVEDVHRVRREHLPQAGVGLERLGIEIRAGSGAGSPSAWPGSASGSCVRRDPARARWNRHCCAGDLAFVSARA